VTLESYLSARDIMAALGVSRSTAYDILGQCDPHVKFGGTLRVAESAFARWLQEHEQKGRQSKRSAPPLDPRIAASADRYHRRRDAVRAAREAALGKANTGSTIRVTRPRT